MGAGGFGFDGDEPDPNEAKNAEDSALHSRTDYSEDQERDAHGRFGSGGSGSVGLEGKGTGSDGGVGRPGGGAGPLHAKGEGGGAKGGGGASEVPYGMGPANAYHVAHEAAQEKAIDAFAAKGEHPIRESVEGLAGARQTVTVAQDLKSGSWRTTLTDRADIPVQTTEHANYRDAVKAAVDHGFQIPNKPSDEVAARLSTEMGTHPFGFSWRPDTGHATSGIMVAEHPNSGSSKIIEFGSAKVLGVTKESDVRQAVHEYVEKHYDAVMKDPSLHFGGWKETDDKEKGGGSRFYLDIAKQYPKEEREAAIAAGGPSRNNQIAVWDVDNSAEIKTGGTGRPTP
jgi:hypothetical protein